MYHNYKNLVFSGGGVLGIAYLGTLEYLYRHSMISRFENLAGTSAGAITSCLVCFNQDFDTLTSVLNSLEYNKIPVKDEPDNNARFLPATIKDYLSQFFDNTDCIARLIKKFGWYSSDYIYSWLKDVIATQFIPEKKLPPYTFADFNNPSLHIDNRIFKNLYIIGTDINKSVSCIFSYETTPYMEVAEAVRISMSVPLLFEAVKSSCSIMTEEPKSIFCDGGMLYNFPITIFDKKYRPRQTLGIYFKSTPAAKEINNLVDYISCALACSGSVQNKLFTENSQNKNRSICIHTGDISPFDFNVVPNDDTYRFLYNAGYRAATKYFSRHKI